MIMPFCPTVLNGNTDYRELVEVENYVLSHRRTSYELAGYRLQSLRHVQVQLFGPRHGWHGAASSVTIYSLMRIGCVWAL